MKEWHEINGKTRRSFLKYVQEIAQAFGLRDWQLYVHFDEDLGDAAAATSCISNRKVAHIKFSTDFFALPLDEQRMVVLHELLHVHMWQITDFTEDAVCDLIGKPAASVFIEAVRRLDEQATDAIAQAISPRYPLWEG